MAPSFSRVSSGALLLALAYNARPVKADFWEDVDNCKLVLDDLPADLTTDFCHDWTYGYEPEDEYVTVTGYPVTVTEYPDAKTCEGEGYSTTTKYPESTPGHSKGYQPSKPTKTPNESTKVPDESTKVPDESTKVPDESTQTPDQTTKAPDQPPATDVPGGYDVTVTSTSWTTYWTTSTVYEGYPTATPAPYRRHARDLSERAAWCVDRPCRLVQYDDDTIVEACKKYLGWQPHTSTVNVPGYTVTVTSYPTDCKKKDDSYKPDPVSAYSTETPEAYPAETSDYPEYPAETSDYEPEPYSTETPEPYPTETPESYPTETPESYPTETPEPYPSAPAPYPENEPDNDNGPSYDDGSHDDGTAPWDSDDTDDDQHSDDKQPWENDFDNNYSGPDGPLPWDDVDQTSELADAIEADGYDNAAQNLGLDDAPWNALPADYPQKRDYPSEDSYGEDGVDDEDGSEGDYDVVWVDENGHPIDESDYPQEDDESTEDSYKSTEDSYQPSEDDYSQGDEDEGSYPEEYAPNLYGPDVDDSGDYSDDKEGDDYAPNVYGPDVPDSGEYDDNSEDYPVDSYDDSYDDSEDSYEPGEWDEPKWVLPDSSEYEGDEFESDYSPQGDGPPETSPGDYWGEDGVDY